MEKPRFDWDPSWDDDWSNLTLQLKDEIDECNPPDPTQAIELYRFGFTAARRHPLPVWSDVESQLYQDYMSGSPDSDLGDNREMSWEQSRDWAHRGFEAGRNG